MKTKIWILLVVLMAGFSWQSCSDDDKDDNQDPGISFPGEFTGGTILTDNKLIYLEEGQTEVQIPFLCNTGWSVETKGDELTFLSETKGNGNGIVKLQIPEGNSSLFTWVKFTFGANTKAIGQQDGRLIIRRRAMVGAAPEGGIDMDAIGWGINLFDKLDAESLKKKVLDYDRLLSEDKIFKDQTPKTDLIEMSGSDYESISKQFSNHLNGSFSPNILLGIIPSPFQASIESYATGQTLTKDYYEWGVSAIVCQQSTYQIEEALFPGEGSEKWFSDEDVKTILEYADPSVAQAINDCNNDTTKIANIFTKYGTHIVTAARFGGRYMNLVGRKKQDYISSIASSTTAALTAKIPVKLLTSIGVNITNTYTEADSICAVNTLDYNQLNIKGGDQSGDIEKWIGSLTDPKNQTFISLATSTNPYKGLVPIWVLCADAKEREAMYTYFVDNYSKRYVKNLQKPKRIIADVIPVYYDDDQYNQITLKGSRPENIDYQYWDCDIYGKNKKRSYKRITPNILVDPYVVTAQHGYKYFYVSWGYDDDEGLSNVEFISRNDENNKTSAGWKLRGSNAREGTGTAEERNRMCVKPVRSGEDAITAVGFWFGDKADQDEKSWQWLSVGNAKDYTWTNGQGIDWYNKFGFVHKIIRISSTKDELKGTDL